MSAALTTVRTTPAKVNLALAVGAPEGERGYHPISSWMAPVDLRDTLTLTPLDESRASRYAILWHDDAPRRTDIDWPIAKDLAVRAHHALEARVGRRLATQLRLDKRIPVGSGMGGGSSNAAAMLASLRDAYSLAIDDEALREIGASIGSDVPYFLDEGDLPRAAIVEGLGDRVERLARRGRDVWLAMVFPPFGCNTGAVYRAFDETIGPDHELRSEEVRDLAGSGEIVSEALFNDLAVAACVVQPALGDLRAAAARSSDSPAHVTGSGSGLFIVARDTDHAEWLAIRLRDDLETPTRAVRVFI